MTLGSFYYNSAETDLVILEYEMPLRLSAWMDVLDIIKWSLPMSLQPVHVFPKCIKTMYWTNCYLWAMDVEFLATT